MPNGLPPWEVVFQQAQRWLRARGWALARSAGVRWRGLAEAFTGGTTRVTFDGRTVEYARALLGAAVAGAAAAGRPSCGGPAPLVLTVAARLRRTGKEVALQVESGDPARHAGAPWPGWWRRHTRCARR